MSRKICLIICLVFAVSIFLTAGVSCTTSPAGDTAGDTYIIGDEDGDWGYPTPYTSNPRGPGYVRLSYIFDTLIWKDSEGFTGALAKEWEFDEAENSYTFQLRDDVQWHDGEPFSASDVVFSFEYYREHPSHWADLELVGSVEQSGEKEITISLEEPYAPFLNNVAGVVPILPAHIWEDVSEPDEFTAAEAVIVTGPYELEDYSREQGLYRYRANPDYYLGEPLVESLLMMKVSDPHLALRRGDINYAMVEPEAVEELEREGFRVTPGDHDFNLKLMFNHQEPPFAEIEFRRALARSIDLEVIVERALRGHGLPGSPGMVTPDSRWFAGEDELPAYDYDPEEARRKLEEMGYTLQDGLLRDEEGEVLSVELLGMADYSRETEIVAGQLADLGIEADTRNAERSVVDNRIRNWDFDLAITGHGGMGGDPEIFRRFMIGEASPHLNARYDSDSLKEALQEQRRQGEHTQRKEAVDKMQRIYAEELPTYTLHYPTWYFAYDDTIDWFFTRDGIATGTPLPLNKMAVVDTE